MLLELIIADSFTLVDTRRMIGTRDHQEIIGSNKLIASPFSLAHKLLFIETVVKKVNLRTMVKLSDMKEIITLM